MSEKRYAVFGLFKSFEVDGFNVTLPKGQWAIPVFESRKDAEEFAGEKFDIIEVETQEKN